MSWLPMRLVFELAPLGKFLPQSGNEAVQQFRRHAHHHGPPHLAIGQFVTVDGRDEGALGGVYQFKDGGHAGVKRLDFKFEVARTDDDPAGRRFRFRRRLIGGFGRLNLLRWLRNSLGRCICWCFTRKSEASRCLGILGEVFNAFLASQVIAGLEEVGAKVAGGAVIGVKPQNILALDGVDRLVCQPTAIRLTKRTVAAEPATTTTKPAATTLTTSPPRP